jgi:hypothetical protein
MKRKIFAVVLGVIAAVVLIIAIEALGHSLYPLPASIDVTDTDAMKAYVTTLPVTALLIVMAAWIVATLVGGLLACFIARETPLIYSAIIGGLVLLGTTINLMSLPHPLWFSITSVLAIIATIFIAGQIGSSFVTTTAVD